MPLLRVPAQPFGACIDHLDGPRRRSPARDPPTSLAPLPLAR